MATHPIPSQARNWLMRFLLGAAAFSSLMLAGCVVAPAPYPYAPDPFASTDDSVDYYTTPCCYGYYDYPGYAYYPGVAYGYYGAPYYRGYYGGHGYRAYGGFHASAGFHGGVHH